MKNLPECLAGCRRYVLSRVQLFETRGLWPARLLSMEYSRQCYYSRLPFPSAGDLPDPGIESVSPASAGTTDATWESAEGKWCYWWCFPQGGRLQAEGAGMKWLDFLSFLSLKPLMRSIIYCSAQESLGQQISLRPQNADWINAFSLGSFFWVSFFTEQLPETGSVYYEKGDRTALFSNPRWPVKFF